MKYCSNCGVTLKDSAALFCAECGSAFSENDPRDEGYDGYYDDVLPVDNGHIRSRRAPELIKRIALITVGAIIIIALSIALMYIL
jgi:uncharacterized membrane protein YvbJ